MRPRSMMFTLVAILFACETESPQLLEISVGGDCDVKEDEGDSADLTQSGTSRDLTFYKDILPILSSTRDNFVFKCSTCHADYMLPHRVARVSEVEAIIEAMKTQSMPIGGDPVQPYLIKRIEVWRLTGMKTGDKSQSPSSLEMTSAEASRARGGTLSTTSEGALASESDCEGGS